MRAPIVVAKGVDLIALASASSRPSTRCRSSRRRRWRVRCMRSCELGDEIPARLYAAVAKVLTYVYQLRDRAASARPRRRRRREIELPRGMMARDARSRDAVHVRGRR